ncbi:glycoside hydrolase [Penicillium angulare]|uniref:chitinase n=1 Tax=Penicillium angulare TaxID=116970 RepID=A0A9W9FI89_9EURO|nr:glycoside hydrolase [Penicillium angulare]
MSLLTALVLSSLVSSTLGSTCKYITANADDGCYNLAQRCDISQDKLTTYNTADNFCNNVLAGDYVCCSEGSLPDFSPKKNSDGSCHSYTVKQDEVCSDIEDDNKMKRGTIEKYNKNTWGWAGCTEMQKEAKICLSDGTPPFPSSTDDALCGPQVKGTVEPKDMSYTNWTNLNPCPLNACCDKWGQCGITVEFCEQADSKTGAPGTSKKGTNGCISNCGTQIVNNDEGPKEVRRIAYYESFEEDRECLKMDISQLENLNYYTHVHWAFANITESYEVDVSQYKEQWDGFKDLYGFRRIVSFGGWGFSTSAHTYTVLRNGVKEDNRQTLAKNIADFVVNNGLEGVDFDWEYPGAQDIPGVAPDSKDSGDNYLEFLKLVRDELPGSKSISIAAPSSYWYLKNFPIKEISEVVDYIVYMTYDLHGQWDYDSKNADSGCPSGGCLRSQVNQTEIFWALSMITKAGVPSNKVVGGLPLYGRSFEMVDPSCSGPNCHFTGPESGATAGECTNTPGYISNYEIYNLLVQAENPDIYGNVTIEQYQSHGDVLIYDGNWISWLSPTSYYQYRDWFDGYNFGGTSDWAVDLNATYNDDGSGDEVEPDLGDTWESCDYSKSFNTLDELSEASAGMRSDCISVYTLQTLVTMLNVAYDNYTDINSGYDELFGYYVTYMEKLVPTILNSHLMMTDDGGSQAKASGAEPKFGEGASYFSCSFGGKTYDGCKGFERSTYLPSTEDITWKLIDEDGWQKKLQDEGISDSYVSYGDYTRHQHTDPAGGRGRSEYDYSFENFPIKNDSMVVPNPKDIMSQAVPHIPTLRNDMQATVYDMILGQWIGGTLDDPAQVYSTAVFSIMQAIESMAQAKKLGEEEKEAEEEAAEEKKRNFILMIVSVVLVVSEYLLPSLLTMPLDKKTAAKLTIKVVPFVGEEAAALAGLTTLARSIAVAGEAANAGLAIYDTVKNPESAIMNVIGSALGIGAIAKAERSGKGLASVAETRAGMKASEIASIGDIFKANDDTLQSLMKVCRLS